MLHVPQRCRCRPVSLACHIHTYVQIIYTYILELKIPDAFAALQGIFGSSSGGQLLEVKVNLLHATSCCCCRAESAVGALHECIFICAIYFNFIKLLTGLQKQTQHSGEVGLTPSLTLSLSVGLAFYLSWGVLALKSMANNCGGLHKLNVCLPLI